jgi:hypothetical protein
LVSDQLIQNQALLIYQAEYTPDDQENAYNKLGILKPENYQYAGYDSDDSHGSVAQRDGLFCHNKSGPPSVEICAKMICF